MGHGNVSVSDPDFQIRRGGCHPDPEIRGVPGLKKEFFLPFGPHFDLTTREGGEPPRGPSPGSATDVATVYDNKFETKENHEILMTAQD